MRYEHTCRLIALAVLVSILFNGCGGGSSSLTLSKPASDGLLEQGDPGNHSSTLRFHMKYDYSGYPSQDGFTVVPMIDDFTPRAPGGQQLSLTVESGTKGPIVSLRAQGSDQVLIHLRYDPAEWQVSGVGTLNPWPGVKDFISFTHVVEPGVLLVYCMPVGDGPAGPATSEFAKVFMRPATGTRVTSVDQVPPSKDYDHAKVVWFAQSDPPAVEPTIVIQGTLEYCLDGQLGDATTKDGLLNGPGEGTKRQANLVHDVELELFGSTYEDPSKLPQGGLDLSWSERLTGDHDDNGVVTIADITPLSKCITPEGTEYYAKSGVWENGELINLGEKMTDPDPLNPWYADPAGHDVQAFYFDNAIDGNPPGFVDADVTPRDTGVDSFWDGYIREHKNWDFEDPDGNPTPDGVPDGYYDYQDELGVWWYRPGDAGTMAKHYGLGYNGTEEWIYGYRIWVVPEGGSTTGVAPKKTYKRGDTSHEPPSGFVGGEFYPDGNWNDNPPPPYNSYRRYEFNLLMTSSFFPLNADGWYDIVIKPYSFLDPSDANTIDYGPESRLVRAIEFDPPLPPQDDYGPQYDTTILPPSPPNLPGSGDPGDASPHLRGLFGVSQTNQYTLTFDYYDADDVNEFHQWGNERVDYNVYAIAYGPNNQNPPPSANQLFQSANIRTGLSFKEPANVPDTFQRVRVATISPDALNDPPINLPELILDGSRIWFGFRASIGTTAEYDFPPPPPPPDNNYGPNMQPRLLDVTDQLAPYFIGMAAPYNSTATPDNDFLRGWSQSDGAIAVYFKRAIDPPLFAATENITYRCFWSANSFDPITLAGAAEVLPAKTINFAATQGPPFDGEAYSFVIDNNGAGLITGQTYFFYVFAQDTSNSLNRSTNTIVHQGNPRNFVTPAITIAANVFEEEANTVGSMVADQSNVYLLYGYLSSPIEEVFLRYQELQGGVWPPNVTENDIIQTPGAPRHCPLSFYSQLHLDFLRDLTGQPVLIGGQRQAAISFSSGADGALSTEWHCRSTGRTGANLWTLPPFRQIQTEEGQGWLTSIAATITNYSFRDQFGVWQNQFIMPWVFYQLAPPGSPLGDLRLNIGNSPNNWPNNNSVLDSTSGYYAWIGDTQGSDIIVKQSALPVGPGQTWTGGNPFIDPGNHLYILANSGAPSTPYNYQFPTLMLYDAGDIQLPNPWNIVDLRAIVLSPGFDGGTAANPSVGPNSMEVTSDFQGTQNFVYVAYSNADLNDGVDDVMGLRVAFSAHNSGGLQAWQSPATAGLIDGTYSYFDAGINPTFDQVDLQVKPGSKVSNVSFNQLGCAYITQRGELRLSETVGSGPAAQWLLKQIQGQNMIDIGHIRWVKLAYLNVGGQDIPYVLYSIRTNPNSPTLHDIRLWIGP